MKHFQWSDLAEPELHYHLAVRHYGPKERFEMHDHDFAELALVLEGGGKNICVKNQYQLSTGSLFFILPTTAHAISAGNEGMTLVNMAFDLKYALDMEDRYFLNEPGYFRNTTAVGVPLNLEEEMLGQISSVLHKASGKPRTRFNLDHTLMSIYGSIRSPLSDTAVIGIPDWLNRACHRFQYSEAYITGAEALYQMAGKSHEHTSREMKKYLGMSPTEFSNGLKLEKAAQALCTTEDSVLQIALDSGFENLSWFHRSFRRKYRITPLQYRKRNQNAALQRDDRKMKKTIPGP